ncbi:MAG: VOC family protein [Myxococcota bacterium]
MPLEIQNFSHVVMQVSNLEDSIAFYQGLLGLEEIFQQEFPEPGQPGATRRMVGCLVGGSVVIEFGASLTDPKPVDGSSSPILAFGVADIEATHQAILDAGVKPLMGPREMAPGLMMVFVQDPDGRTIEFAQFPDGQANSAEYALARG